MEKGHGPADGIGESERGFNDGKSGQLAAVTQHVEPHEGLLCVHSSSFLYRMAQLLRTYPSDLCKINLLSVNLNLKNTHSLCTQRSSQLSGRTQSSVRSCYLPCLCLEACVMPLLPFLCPKDDDVALLDGKSRERPLIRIIIIICWSRKRLVLSLLPSPAFLLSSSLSPISVVRFLRKSFTPSTRLVLPSSDTLVAPGIRNV